MKHSKDSADTEELYRQNIASNYENTIETAIPQTELYNVIKEQTETNENTPATSADTVLTGEATKNTYANPVESTTEDTLRWVKEFEIEKLPTKTTYYVNEEFSLDGIIVKAYLNDGSVEDVTRDVTLLYIPSTEMPGTKTVVLEYVDNFNDLLNLFTDEFVITIIESETATLADEETAPDTTATSTEEATDL